MFRRNRPLKGPLMNPISERNTALQVILIVAVGLVVLIVAALLLLWWYRNRLISYYTREEKRTDFDDSLYADNSTMGADSFQDVKSASAVKAHSINGTNGTTNGVHHSTVIPASISPSAINRSRAESDV